MSLSSIGQNGAEEFFETILYQTAYTEAKDQVKGFTKNVENDVIQEALEGAMSVITAGLIFQLMRVQEDFIGKIFETSKGLVIILLGSGYADKMRGKLSRIKGFKLFKKLDMFKSSYQDRVATAQVVMSTAGNHFKAESVIQKESNTVSDVTAINEHIVSKEKLNHDVGSTMASRYNETLMFKLFTKSFTKKDEKIMKKILGKDSTQELEVEDMNQVADFMFVKDSNGNATGLSEQLFQLLNGLGYMNKV